MSTLIIGEAPSLVWYDKGIGKSGRKLTPFDGPGGERIAKLIGVSLEEWLDNYERVNLFDVPIGYWEAGRAQLHAACMIARPEYKNVNRLILFGRKVEKAVIGTSFDYFQAHMRGFPDYAASDKIEGSVLEMVTAPHPSGLSRWWNDEELVERARVWWKADWERSKEEVK